MTTRGGTRKVARVALAAVAIGLGGLPPTVAAQVNVPRIIEVGDTLATTRIAIFGGLANQIGTLPNPTGGGFSFAFDPALGVFTRTTESFGSVFANRAETTGRGKLTLNASWSRHTFDEADGKSLTSGTPPDGIFPVVAQRIPGGIFFDVLALQEHVRADVFTVGVLYGVTDRIDVGLTIPILNVRVKERVREVGFFACNRALTVCTDPVLTLVDFRPNSAEQTGLGDIVVRGKWNFLRWDRLAGGRAGLAAALDVKLPTGDDGDRDAFTRPERFLRGVNLFGDISQQQFGLGDPPLGTGIVRVKPQLVFSGTWFGLSPRVSVGAELGTTTGITNDFVYEVGVDYNPAPWVTVSVDVLGRHAFDVRRRRVRNFIDDDFGQRANPDTYSLSLGIKVNPVGTLLVFANVLVPLDNTGIRDELTPTVGLEWSF